MNERLNIPWRHRKCPHCLGKGYQPSPTNLYLDCPNCDGARFQVLCRKCEKYIPASDPVVCDYGICFKCREMLKDDLWDATSILLDNLKDEDLPEELKGLVSDLKVIRNQVEGV